jgi:hypothetical protein
MKLSHALLILVASATVVFAHAIMPYDNAKPPTMSLPVAYEQAIKALGSSTNQFHCISASISTWFGPPGWYFKFCTTNTPPKYEGVTVEFGGKIHVVDSQQMKYPCRLTMRCTHPPRAQYVRHTKAVTYQ